MSHMTDQSPRRNFPFLWRLSPAKDRILTQLAQKGQASKELIAYLACPVGKGSLDAVKAQISQLRRDLARADAPVTIHNIRGWGYQIDRAGQDYLREFLPDEEKQREVA